MKIKAFILFPFLISALASAGQELVKLLPGADLLPGWKISQEPRVYDGDGLFELIDGGADIYMEYGFSKVVSAQYTDPSQNNILAEIYEMEDHRAAYGIFSISQQTLQWSEQFGSLSAVSDDYISFWKGKYYVNLSWSSRQHLDQPLLAKLALTVAAGIPGGGDYPKLVTDFQTDVIKDKLIYLEGNLALSNFYYFDYHRISDKNPDGFLESDFRNLVKKEQ